MGNLDMNPQTIIDILKRLNPVERRAFADRIAVTSSLSREAKQECEKAYKDIEATEKRLESVGGYGGWS